MVKPIHLSRTNLGLSMPRSYKIALATIIYCLLVREVRGADFLYVSMSDQTVVRYDVSLAIGSAIQDSKEIFVSSSRAQGIGFDSLGSLYVANRNSLDTTQVHATISKFDSNGNFLGHLSQDFLDLPSGLAVDSENYVHAASQQYGWIPRYKPDGTLDSVLTAPSRVYGIAIDSNNNLYASAPDSGAVIKFNSQGDLINSTGNPFGGYDFPDFGLHAIINPFFLAVDSLDNVYATSQVNTNVDLRQTVKKFDSNGNYLLTFDTNYLSNGVGGLTVDRNGSVFVASGRNIVKFDSHGNYVLSWSTGNLDPYYLALPVPEPTTYMLCSLCIICLVGMEYYQRKRLERFRLSQVHYAVRLTNDFSAK